MIKYFWLMNRFLIQQFTFDLENVKTNAVTKHKMIQFDSFALFILYKYLYKNLSKLMPCNL